MTTPTTLPVMTGSESESEEGSMEDCITACIFRAFICGIGIENQPTTRYILYLCVVACISLVLNWVCVQLGWYPLHTAHTRTLYSLPGSKLLMV